MLSHNLPVKIEPQQNEAYNTKFKTNIVWKQLFKNPHLADDSSWTVNTAYGTKAVADNKLTYTITTKNANQAITQASIPFTQNRIYLLSCWLTVSEDQVVGVYTGNSVTNIANVKANVRTRIFNVFKSNITSTRTCYIYPARNSGLAIGGTAILEDACLYDLTEMFGEGKEMLGRFSFLSNFPNNYYDYDVSGDSVPFTIPVYGGSINIKTGLLQITKYNIDLGYLFWQYSAAQASTGKYRKACAEVLFEPVTSSSSYPDLISSGYKAETGNNVYVAMQGISITTTGGIMIFDERYPLQNDLPEYANAVKGITACGVMASPVTYNLTPAEVKTLLGNNKISSNATELQLTYKNSQNENVSLTGNTEYTIEDGVFDRPVLSATNLFSPKQNLNGWTYPYFSGLGPVKLDFEPLQGSVSGIDYDTTQRVYGDNFVLFDSHGNAPSTSATSIDVDMPVRNGNFYNQGKSTLSISIPTAHWPDRQVTLDNLMLYVKLLNEEMGIQDAIIIYDLNEPISFTDTLANNNKIAYVQVTLLKKDTDTFLPVFLPLNIQYDYSDTVTPINYNVLPVPHYTNICPIEAYTESSVTVEGDRVPDSESERRLKAITRPVFQWDFGLKLKFEGYTFADGTLCQFDNKITAYSLNTTIENNECTIPYQLLDENCQGDIVAYINASGNNYDVVVYEVYIPVIKRPKPENFLRPAIDLPSAVIASFADGADNVPLEKLKIAVTPKQDLHGYDYPWVGGGGKNKFDINFLTGDDITIENGGASGTAKAFYFDFGRNGASVPIPNFPSGSITLSLEAYTDGNEQTSGTGLYVRIYYTDDSFDGIGIANNTSSYQRFSFSTNANKTIQRLMFSYSTGTNNIWHICNVQLESGTTPTAYAPYENICPITGYTEANVTRTGKNLFDLNYLTATGITIENGEASGTASAFNSAFGTNAGGIPNVKIPSDKITLSCDAYTGGEQEASTDNGLWFGFHYTNGNTNCIKFKNNTTGWTRDSVTSNEALTVDFIVVTFANKPNNIWHLKNIQLESGASQTVYESHASQTYNIPFTDAPKVGEGTLDIKSGVLTITKKFKEFNGTEDWQSVGGSYPQAYSLRTGETNAKQWFPDAESRGITNLFKWSTVEVEQYGIRWQTLRDTSLTNRGLLYVYDAAILNNLNAFKALLTESHLQIVYHLLEPEVYQLTPTEVKTLLGYNNIWADTGEVEVSYYADPYLHFID